MKTVHGKGRRAKVLEPFYVNDHTWFYAEATGFVFVHRPCMTGMIKVPTHLLRKALALLEKAK